MYKIKIKKIAKEEGDNYPTHTTVFTHKVESIDLPNLIVDILNNTTQLEGLESDDSIEVPEGEFTLNFEEIPVSPSFESDGVHFTQGLLHDLFCPVCTKR
jgi:hypothetical protein